MKKSVLISFSFLFILMGCCNKKTAEIAYQNPLPIAFGDPFILKVSDGKFYMYGTSERNGFKAYSSDDLINWNDEGLVYEGATPDSWTIDCFWAPEVYERNGKYYLWYSANWKQNPTNEGENFRIGVAISDKPVGPFTEMNGGPVFDPGYPIIDANLLFDDENEKVYLYYSRCCYKHPVESEIADQAKEKGWFNEIEESWIYGVELKPDYSGVIGEPVLLLRPPVTLDDRQSEWESRSVTDNEVNRRWTEGSYIFKDGNLYYMMYSANFFGGANYAVGYATSEHPLGSFEKSPDNPVLQKNIEAGGNVTGTGHNMVLTMPDGQMLCVYHGRTEKTGNERMVFIDKMEITDNGKLIIHGPTTSSDAVISIEGNAYVTKQTGTNRDGLEIRGRNIRNWNDPNDVISIYFHSDEAQIVDMAIKAKGRSTICLSYAGKSKKIQLNFSEEKIIDVGKLKIKDPGYVRIDLQGINKEDIDFGTISELILKNPKGKITYVHDFSSYWGRRGPSVHMAYPFPKDTVEWFYNEVTVPEEAVVVGSYYMVTGFNGGYCGIQCNSETERRVLFSVWSPYETDDPKSIPKEYQVEKLRQGEGVHIGEFGNEGSGGQSYLRYDWESGLTYKFLTRIRPDGKGNTVFTAYFYAPDEDKWRLIASFLRPKTDIWYQGAHSFLENFIPAQGYLTRYVKFGNQWALDKNGNWHELTQGRFTYDATAAAGVRLDYQGGVLDNQFYLKNCGFFNENTSYREVFERKPNKREPQIDFMLLETL